MMKNEVRKNLEQFVEFLQPLLQLANSHMVDYFTKNLYIERISSEIRSELENLGHKEAIEQILQDDLTKTQHLLKFSNTCKTFNIANNRLCLNLDVFKQKLNQWGHKNEQSIKLDVFVTEKKSHEVEILSFVAAGLREVFDLSHLIDIGDGKGYLSSLLGLHYKVPVLGVDASAINTEGAVKRVTKLSKRWNTAVKNPNCKPTVEHYKQITKFVDESVDFTGLIESIFLEKPEKLGLVGLHTCGDLSPNSLRLYSSNNDIKTICNVGCCYHLLHEEFDNKNMNLNKFGFPLSDFLRNKQFVLGQNARMIAAQAIDRIFEKKDLPNRTIFYRAVFEAFLEEFYPETENRLVGRFRKPVTCYVDYVRKALKRLNLEIRENDDDLINFYRRYEKRQDELNLFYLIRCMLSPAIEGLIVLDKLMFLMEKGFEDSFLVQLFDPVISPRCYGIVSTKLLK